MKQTARSCNKSTIIQSRSELPSVLVNTTKSIGKINGFIFPVKKNLFNNISVKEMSVSDFRGMNSVYEIRKCRVSFFKCQGWQHKNHAYKLYLSSPTCKKASVVNVLFKI